MSDIFVVIFMYFTACFSKISSDEAIGGGSKRSIFEFEKTHRYCSFLKKLTTVIPLPAVNTD